MPSAPVEPSAESTKRSLPPIFAKFSASQGSSAPVACSEALQVLPMLRTSGPWPEVVAVRMRLSRSDQGTTSSFTLMPVCFSNLSISGWRTFLSTSMLAPWLEAQ